MKLYWAHDGKYPEDIKYYTVENTEDLKEQIAKERGLSADQVNERFYFGELSHVFNEKLGKYFKISVEEDQPK